LTALRGIRARRLGLSFGPGVPAAAADLTLASLRENQDQLGHAVRGNLKLCLPKHNRFLGKLGAAIDRLVLKRRNLDERVLIGIASTLDEHRGRQLGFVRDRFGLVEPLVPLSRVRGLLLAHFDPNRVVLRGHQVGAKDEHQSRGSGGILRAINGADRSDGDRNRKATTYSAPHHRNSIELDGGVFARQGRLHEPGFEQKVPAHGEPGDDSHAARDPRPPRLGVLLGFERDLHASRLAVA
jgi:hypothetical protein